MFTLTVTFYSQTEVEHGGYNDRKEGTSPACKPSYDGLVTACVTQVMPGGRVPLPHMGYIGMCAPKEYLFYGFGQK